MGCSNTLNNKKKNVKIEKKVEGKEPSLQGSAGTNEGRSISDDKPRESNPLTGPTTGTKKVKDIEIYKDFNDVEEDETKSIPNNCINVKVQADTVEQMFPIWIEKGIKTKIYVRGKWSLFSEGGMVSYKGHTNFNHQHRELPIGALIGRIHGGTYFAVRNGMTYESKVSGPVYFFANNS